MKRTTLLSKINTAIWLVCAIVLMAFSLVFYSFEKGQRQERREQVKVLLGAVFQDNREDLANEIFSNHQEALSHTIADIQKIKGVTGVQIFKLDGKRFISHGDFPKEDPNLADIVETNDSSYRHVVRGKNKYLTLTTVIEVVGERVGFCRIWYDLSRDVKASQQRMLLIIGVFFLTLLMLSIVLHRLLTRWVIKPVSILHNAMGRVMNGHLGEQLQLQQQDEIGQMATAFNTMSLTLKEQKQRLIKSMQARDSYAQQLEQTNQQLAKLNTELESIVEERTRELRKNYKQLQMEILERQKTDSEKKELEERLARSEKMEALGLLAGGVAHDLNNVLSGIVSYPDLILLKLEENSQLRHMIQAMKTSGQKAAAIVQDMLALARRGVRNTNVINFNTEIISDYLKSPELKKLRTFHPAVTIETRLTADLMNIRGSSIHLKKAFMNLVSNAAEAQPEGGKIVISTKNRYVDQPFSSYEQVNEGDYILVTVEDFGTGIDEDAMELIFEPFYTKKAMGRSGTGLGMAVVWGTVQDHKGYIDIKSTLGKGTRFDLYFPVTREEQLKGEEAVSIEHYMGTKEKILVIDDMPEQRKLARALLHSLNYTVTTVGSGEDAISYLKENSVDLLLLDMIMAPGIDGLDTYRKILHLHPHQKAVIASGFAENKRVKEAQRLGAGVYVRKPYTMEKIAIAIRKELLAGATT